MAIGTTVVTTSGLPGGANPAVNLGAALNPNSVYLVGFNITFNSAPNPFTQPSGMTDTSWTAVQNYEFRTASFSRRMALYYTVTGSSPSGTILTFSGMSAGGQGGGMFLIKLDGVVASALIVQSKQGPADGSASAVTATLDAAMGKASNMHFALVAHRGGGTATGTGGGTSVFGTLISEIGAVTALNDTSIGANFATADNVGWISAELRALLTQSAAGSITPTGAVTTLKKALLSVAGSITPTGVLTTLHYKALSVAGSITPVGTLAMKRLKHLLQAIGEIAGLILTPRSDITKTLTPLDPPDDLTLTPNEEQQA